VNIQAFRVLKWKKNTSFLSLPPSTSTIEVRVLERESWWLGVEKR